MHRTYRRELAALLIAAVVLTACGTTASTTSPATPSSTEPGTATKLKVVATFSVLGDLVHNVAGDRVELTTLVPAGGDAHTFEPSPADSVQLAEADVVVENGLGFESWLPDLFTASDSQARRIVAAEGITTLAAPEHDEEAGHEEGDDHGDIDPHIWHDVDNAIQMVEHIRDGLVAADAANAATYQTNADAYIQQLKQLDSFVVEQANTLPPERRKLVTTHDTFGYLARRYGFDIVGTTLGSVTTEVADPSAAAIARLVEEIKASGVPAIFVENIEGVSLTERVADEAGVDVAPPLYTDALGEPGSAGDTYAKMIRYNIETIVAALSK